MPRSTNQAQKEAAPSPVSLIAGPADVPQPGPSKEIVIKDVPPRPVPEPMPAPVVVYGDDGSITIK